MYTLGIDLHKKSSVWVLIDDERKILWKGDVASHPLDITSAIKKLPVPPEAIRAAIEPVTGWRWVVAQLRDMGMDVRIAHPQKIRLIAESDQKHDKGDALMLAELLRAGYFPESVRASDDMHRLRTILREREYFVGLRTSVKNRLHGLATTKGLHLIPGGNPLQRRGKAAIMGGDDVALIELHRAIADLDLRILPFDRVIAKEILKLPLAKRFMTIPGVGPITALMVIAEVADFSRFASPEKLASFAGLIPRQRSSGGTLRFGSLTNAGSRHLRTALVETAMRITEANAPELYAFVERLKPTTGAKRARVALARKLLVIMWAMAKTGESYRPKLVPSLSAPRNTRMGESR
ncbi:MAG: IS110 family transposase [bacterium]|nr:IS110 family transposase [bacterium]